MQTTSFKLKVIHRNESIAEALFTVDSVPYTVFLLWEEVENLIADGFLKPGTGTVQYSSEPYYYQKTKSYDRKRNFTIQVDAKEPASEIYRWCNLHTGERVVRFAMKETDYLELIRSGFFIRNGTWLDDAKVWNTTEVYV
jgi:hypothetical protein